MTSPRDGSLPSLHCQPGLRSYPRANHKWVIITVETCWQISWCSGSDYYYTEVKTISCVCVTQFIVLWFLSTQSSSPIMGLNLCKARISWQPAGQWITNISAATHSQHNHSVHGQVNFVFCNSASADLGNTLCIVIQLCWLYTHSYISHVSI